MPVKSHSPNCAPLSVLWPGVENKWLRTGVKGLKLENLCDCKHGKSSIWFQCPQGHVWKSTIEETYVRFGDALLDKQCPTCAGATTPGINDLVTLHPEVAKDLRYVLLDEQGSFVTRNKRSRYAPHKLSPESPAVAVFCCSGGHRSKQTIVEKVQNPLCKKCQAGAAPDASSRPERALREAVFASDSFVGTVMKDNHILPVPWGRKQRARVDIVTTLNQHNVVMEYDGWYWHKSEVRELDDVFKTRALLQAGYFVVRIREQPLDLLPVEAAGLVQISWPTENFYANINQLVEAIVQGLTNATNSGP